MNESVFKSFKSLIKKRVQNFEQSLDLSLKSKNSIIKNKIAVKEIN